MPTFGKTVVGANTTTSTIAGGYQQCCKFTLAEAATVTDLRIYLTGVGGGGTQVIRAVCWADSAAAPGALKITADEQTLNASMAGAWVTFTLPSSVPLLAGDYWLGWTAGATDYQLYYAYDVVTAVLKYRAVAYGSSPSDPYGTADGSANAEISAYATYTPLAAAPTLNTIVQSNMRSA